MVATTLLHRRSGRRRRRPELVLLLFFSLLLGSARAPVVDPILVFYEKHQYTEAPTLKSTVCPITEHVPCRPGSHHNPALPFTISQSQCILCAAGTYCPRGAEAPIPCHPGTIGPKSNASSCEQCPAGKFQHESGQTSCHDCIPGHYCPHGTSAPWPCPPGTYSDGLNLTNV